MCADWAPGSCLFCLCLDLNTGASVLHNIHFSPGIEASSTTLCPPNPPGKPGRRVKDAVAWADP